jgi:hypothetical protein
MKFEGRPIELRPLDNLETKISDGDLLEHSNLEELKELFSNIKNCPEDKESALKIKQMLEDMSDRGDVAFLTILEEFFNIDSSEYLKLKSIFSETTNSALSGNQESSSLLLKIVTRYEEYSTDLFETMKEKSKVIRVDFIEGVNKMLEENGTEYDLAKVAEIVNSIQINFFTSNYFSRKNVQGGYMPRHKVYIKIDKGVFPTQYKNAMYHELLHAITADLENIFSFEGESNNLANRGTQSDGLEFRGIKTKRFEWLNEAVTENLATYLSKQSSPRFQSFSYEQERNMLDILISKKKKGVDLDLNSFNKTYFRVLRKNNGNDLDTNNDWKNLNEKIDEAFCPRFLVKLDLFIEKNGIDKAVKIIETWENGNPNTDDITYLDW